MTVDGRRPDRDQGTAATGSQAIVPQRLASGRIIDLAHPELTEFDWMVDHAGPLARIKRYGGQTPDLEFSIAEHSSHGSDAIVAEGEAALEARRDLESFERRRALRKIVMAALGFHIHDNHEDLGGDMARPFTDLCEMIAARDAIAPSGTFRRIMHAAKDHLDATIFRQAGLPWPLPAEIQFVISAMDERMAAEEMRRFWPKLPLPKHYETLRPVHLSNWPIGEPAAWNWQRAQAEWITRFNHLRKRLEGLSS